MCDILIYIINFILCLDNLKHTRFLIIDMLLLYRGTDKLLVFRILCFLISSTPSVWIVIWYYFHHSTFIETIYEMSNNNKVHLIY